MHSFLSLSPVMLAAIIAIFFRKGVLALFLGTVLAAVIAADFNLEGAIEILMINIGGVLFNKLHLWIVAFSIMISSLIGLLSKTGALRAFFVWLFSFASGFRSAQLLTCLFPVSLSFDAETSCLLTTDYVRKEQKILLRSPERLAYYIDGMASVANFLLPISIVSIFFVTLLHETSKSLGINLDSYELFIKSIPYNYYGFFYLVSLLAVSLSRNDVLYISKTKHNLKPQENKNPSDNGPLFLFFVAMPTFFIGTAVMFILFKILLPESQESYMAAVIAASVSLFLTIFISLYKNMITPETMLNAMSEGINQILPMIVLILFAWAFAQAIDLLGTAEILYQWFSNGSTINLLPTTLFVSFALAAIMCGNTIFVLALFAPIVLPIIFLTGSTPIILFSIASIASGITLGSQVSEVSDTSIFSSIGARCDIALHVKEQIPFAMLSGGFALILSGCTILFELSDLNVLLFGPILPGAAIFAFYTFFNRASFATKIHQ